MYTVKEAAKLLHLTEHAIRYYTDMGLVPNVVRDSNNNRLFDDESLHWLSAVKFLKQCSMSIKDIRRYVDLCLEGDSTVEERYEIILKQKAVALNQLEDIQQSIEYLERKEKLFLDVISAVVPDNTNPGKRAVKNQDS